MNHQLEQKILDALQVLPAIQQAVSQIPYLIEQVKYIPYLVEQVQHIPYLVDKVNRLEQWSIEFEQKVDRRFEEFEHKVDHKFEEFEKKVDLKFEVRDAKIDLLAAKLEQTNQDVKELKVRFGGFETELAVLSATVKRIDERTTRTEQEVLTIRAQVAGLSELAATVAEHDERIQHLEHKVG